MSEDKTFKDYPIQKTIQAINLNLVILKKFFGFLLILVRPLG